MPRLYLKDGDVIEISIADARRIKMWQLADKTLSSRLLLGTAQYPSLEIMREAIVASQTRCDYCRFAPTIVQ